MTSCIGLFSKHKLEFMHNGRIRCDKCKCQWDLEGRELIPCTHESWKAWRDEFDVNRPYTSAPESTYSHRNALPLRDVALTLVEEVIKRNFPLFQYGSHEVSAQDRIQIEALRHQASKDPTGFIREVLGRH